MIRRRTLLLAVATALFLAVPQRPNASAGQPYLVSDRSPGVLWRLVDQNGDGDALDAGERVEWASGMSDVVELATDGRGVYAVEDGLPQGTNRVLRFEDRNGDGDALDAGERTVWLDRLTSPRGILRGSTGAWFVSDLAEGEVLRLVDANGDGDVLDAGERTRYAAGLLQPVSLLSAAEGLYVTAFIGDTIHRLSDLNGDGDALDAGEQLAVIPTVNEPLGLLADGADAFYFASRSEHTVYRAEDRNRDGDFLDVAEVLSYADTVYGGLNGPWGMIDYQAGGFLLADNGDGQVLLVNDLTGDGDALDIGEVTTFADDMTLPVDFVALSQLIRWNDPAGGTYSTPIRWEPTRLPTADDHVFFDLDATYTTTVNIAAASRGLTIAAGDVTFVDGGTPRTYAIGTGGLEVSGGALHVQGQILLTSEGPVWVRTAATLEIAAGVTLSAATLHVEGTLEIGLQSPSAGGFGQVAAAGHAELAGTLEASPQPAYVDPSVRGASDSFDFLTVGSRNGSFAVVRYRDAVLLPTFGPDTNGSFRTHVGTVGSGLMAGLFRNLTYADTSVTWSNYLAVAGDADGDGLVTASADGGRLLAGLGSGPDQAWTDGDFTGDGLVTASADGSLLLAGLGTDQAADRQAVPEPAAHWLLAGATIGWLWGRRRWGRRHPAASPKMADKACRPGPRQTTHV